MNAPSPSLTANAQAATANAWIEWTGGDCPVSHDTVVDVRHADGKVTEAVRAGDAIDDDPFYGFDWWAHKETQVDTTGFINRYRVVPA